MFSFFRGLRVVFGFWRKFFLNFVFSFEFGIGSGTVWLCS